MVEATHPKVDRKEKTGPSVLKPPNKFQLLNLHHPQQHQSVGHTVSTLSFEGPPSSGLHQQEGCVCMMSDGGKKTMDDYRTDCLEH